MRKILFALLIAVGAGSTALATPITFVHTGTGSGTLSGVPFQDAAFTITSTGDTDDRNSDSPGTLFIDHLTSMISINGIGVLTFITGTRTFVTGNIVGFSRAGITGADLYNGPVDPVFLAWDMLTPIGPIAGEIGLLQWTFSPVVTSAGVLVFDSDVVAGTFQAIVGQIPEPATLALVLMASLAVAGMQLRRGAR